MSLWLVLSTLTELRLGFWIIIKASANEFTFSEACIIGIIFFLQFFHFCPEISGKLWLVLLISVTSLWSCATKLISIINHLKHLFSQLLSRNWWVLFLHHKGSCVVFLLIRKASKVDIYVISPESILLLIKESGSTSMILSWAILTFFIE